MSREGLLCTKIAGPNNPARGDAHGRWVGRLIHRLGSVMRHAPYRDLSTLDTGSLHTASIHRGKYEVHSVYFAVYGDGGDMNLCRSTCLRV